MLEIDNLKLRLSKIEIEEFKCFKDFKVDGLKRVNLICGKRRVGKTTFMRYIFDRAIEYADYCRNGTAISFIGLFGMSDSEIIRLFQSNKNQNIESDLTRLLLEFDDSIESAIVIDYVPHYKIHGIYIDLRELGEGLKRYISIILVLYECRDSYLFIDGVDLYLHHRELSKLWETILTISKEVNCQVFITTHSKESLEAFSKVAEKLNDTDISLMTLVRNQQQEVKGIILDSEGLAYSIDCEHELRGW